MAHDPRWLEYQRKRFTRENAYLHIRPDADRWLRPEARHLLPPNWRRRGNPYADRAASDAPETRAADVSAETEALRFRAEIAAIRFELALLKAARFFRKYSPDQPRVPAGNPDGGQWTRVGGSRSGSPINADGQGTGSESTGSEESFGNGFDLGALYAQAEAQGGSGEGEGALDSQSRTDSERPFRLAADITGFTRHGINQTINRGVSPSAIQDAVVNPLHILPQPNGTTRYVGSGAVVVLDPRGRVVTVWGQ